jgi:single-stranded-DNA-specific exonuclease
VNANAAIPPAGSFEAAPFPPREQPPQAAAPKLSKRWTVAASPPEADALARAASIPLVVAELLWTRGIRTQQEAELFLSPRFDALNDPYAMLGMRTAVDRIQRAIAQKETVLIYGDYDVDGTIAVVLLKTTIEILGGVCRFHVPHRLRDGYGMQAGQLSQIVADGVQLLISVDNGIRAFAAAEEAQRLGLDLIVTDHHLPDAAQGIPVALAVLNPNQSDCAYPCKHLCGAGVAFKLAQALLEAKDRERARTKLLPSFLKLLAIATIADAVPLLEENRVFTSLGIEQLANPVQPGLRALVELAEIQPYPHRLTARDIGFRLAPRLNAAGRMDVASDVVDLFTTRDPVHARSLAEKLHRLNTDRRTVEQNALSEIERTLEDPGHAQAHCVVLDGDGWHRGVIGILASRVVDRTGKPALVLTHENGEAFGSGRSIAGFHLLDAISTCGDLFTRFGGHAHAVGFSLPSALVPELRKRMETYASQYFLKADAVSELYCAAELPLDRLTPALQSWLHRFAPYGMENEEPVFLARRVRVSGSPRIMKERHIRLRLSQGPTGASWPAVGWNLAKTLYTLGVEENFLIDVAYKLRESEDNNSSSMELEIVDLRGAEME